jgi:hypothetical protein
LGVILVTGDCAQQLGAGSEGSASCTFIDNLQHGHLLSGLFHSVLAKETLNHHAHLLDQRISARAFPGDRGQDRLGPCSAWLRTPSSELHEPLQQESWCLALTRTSGNVCSGGGLQSPLSKTGEEQDAGAPSSAAVGCIPETLPFALAWWHLLL